MYNKVLKFLQTQPQAYEKGDTSIWTDKHIAKQLLAAHLAPEFEGASRTQGFMDSSAAWIKQVLPPARYRCLLDVGCGPGLYAERFAREGYSVTGIDFSQESIHYAVDMAHRQGLDIQYTQQDYLQMDWTEAFQAATFIYCDYGALSDIDRAMILRKIHKGLQQGGMLVLDVFSIKQYEEFEEGKTWENCPEGGFWSAEKYTAINEARRYGDSLTLRKTAILTQKEVRCIYLWDTCFTPESLAKELHAAGFKVCGVYGDVAGAAYTPASPTVAVLAQKQ